MTTATETRQLTYRAAISEAIRQEMTRDPMVVVMGEDVAGGAASDNPEHQDAWGGVLGVTQGLIEEFGRDRVRDTPITESAFVGCGVGAAATGLRPVVELMFIGFLGVCLDQLTNQAAKMRYMFGGKATIPLTIRTMIGAGCKACDGNGYKGRMGLFEVLELDDQVRRLIISGEPSAVLRDHALEQGLMKTLRSDGIRKVISGSTSVAEVIRVTSADEH